MDRASLSDLSYYTFFSGKNKYAPGKRKEDRSLRSGPAVGVYLTVKVLTLLYAELAEELEATAMTLYL